MARIWKWYQNKKCFIVSEFLIMENGSSKVHSSRITNDLFIQTNYISWIQGIYILLTDTKYVVSTEEKLLRIVCQKKQQPTTKLVYRWFSLSLHLPRTDRWLVHNDRWCTKLIWHLWAEVTDDTLSSGDIYLGVALRQTRQLSHVIFYSLNGGILQQGHVSLVINNKELPGCLSLLS